MATKAATQIALTAKDTDNRIIGNDLNNLITGNAFGIVINGGFGNDTINGGAGDDEIFGDEGKDSINGGEGRDTLTGGDGADCFVFFNADSLVRKPDTITDFNKSAGDTLNFGDLVTLAGQWNSADVKAKPPATNINQAIFDTAKQTLYVNSDADSAFEFAVVLTGITDISQITLI